MSNIEFGFRIDTLSLNDNVLITERNIDPSINPGYEAPIGSLLINPDTGLLYRKYDVNDIDWLDASGAAAPTGSIVTTLSSIAWIPSIDGYYYQDVVHNLNNTNLITVLYRLDTSPNELILCNNVIVSDSNTIRIESFGNPNFDIKLIILSTSNVVNNINIQNNTVPIASTNTLNFVGFGVNDVSGVTTITNNANTNKIKTLSYFAASVESPNNSDWIVNDLSPATVDPSFNSFIVREFSNVGQNSIGFNLPIPTGANNVSFIFRGRSNTSPPSTQEVAFNLYTRLIPNNLATPSWNSNIYLISLPVSSNNFYKYYIRNFTLASLGLIANETYLVELTRNNTSPTANYNNDWFLYELTIEFT